MKSYVTRTECNQVNQKFMDEIKDIKTKIDRIDISLAELPEKLAEKFDGRYVSKEAFKPVKLIAYALVGALGGIILILLNLLFKKQFF